jgi:hypothetical protein
MASEYEHASPDVKALVVRMNDPYATLITKLTEGMMGIANDRNAIVFADKDGNFHKTFQDSTEDGVIPENSVVFVDSDGKATYDTGFKIDIANARIEFPLPFTLAFGDQDTNGSMRIRVTTDGIYFGKRVAGVWNEAEMLA